MENKKTRESAVKIVYKGIVISATGSYNIAKKRTIAHLTTDSPATGEKLAVDCRVPDDLSREQLGNYLQSGEGQADLQLLYKKYADAYLAAPFVSLSNLAALACYYLVSTSEVYQKELQELLKAAQQKSRAKSRKKKDEALTDSLPTDRLTHYLSQFAGTPIGKITNGTIRAVDGRLAASPDYTQKLLQRCAARLKIIMKAAKYYDASVKVPTPVKDKRKSQALRRSTFGVDTTNLSQTKRIMEILAEDAPHDGRAIGAGCVLLGSVDFDEACGLQYGDVITMPDYSGYSLQIQRPYIVDRGSAKEFGEGIDGYSIRTYQIRKIPLCNWLLNLILSRLTTYDATMLRRTTPLCCYQNQPKRAATKAELMAYIKDVYARAGVKPGKYARREDETGRIQEKTIAVQAGVMMKTCRALLSGEGVVSDLREGECNYLAGLKPASTLDSNYRDFQCGMYQGKMKEKLDDIVEQLVEVQG